MSQPVVGRRGPASRLSGHPFDIFQSLRSEGYAALWSADLCWEFAWWIEVVAGGWLVLRITNSPWLLAWAGFSRTIPILLLSAPAGAIADRLPRRRLLIGLQLLDAAVMFAMAALLIAGQLRYWHIVVAAVVLGIARSLDWPARRALLMDLVGGGGVENAMALESFAIQAATVLGPIVAGAALVRGGAAAAYGLLGVLYAFSLIPLFKVPTLPGVSRTRNAGLAGAARDLREGLAFARKDPVVRAVLLLTLIASFMVVPLVSFLPVMARDVFHLGPLGLGILTSASGVGAAAASILLAGIRRVGSPAITFVGGALLMGLFLLLFALSPALPLALACLILLGAANAAYTAQQSGIVLGRAAPEMRGRLMGILFLAVGFAPLGILAIGAAVARWGAPAGLAAGGAVAVLLTAAVTLRAHGLAGQPASQTSPRAQPA